MRVLKVFAALLLFAGAYTAGVLFLMNYDTVDVDSVDFKLFVHTTTLGYDKEYKDWEKEVKNGYVEYRLFEGSFEWKIGSELWSNLFTDEPTWMEDFKESDIYSEYFLVTFDTTDVSTQVIESVEVKNNNKVIDLVVLNDVGSFNFVGWYNGDTLFTEDSLVTKKTDLVAKFSEETPEEPTPTQTYTITYVLNSGVAVANATEWTTGDEAITLLPSNREGFTFDGWFDNSELIGIPVTGLNGLTDNLTLYAKFTVILYNIAYDTNYSNSAQYAIESNTIELGQPIVYNSGFVTCISNDEIIEAASFANGNAANLVITCEIAEVDKPDGWAEFPAAATVYYK